MKFDLNTIKRGENDKIDLDFVVNLESIDYYGDVLNVIAPVSVLGSLYSIGKKIFLSCKLETDLEVHCGRCLKPFIYLLKTNIDVELTEEDEAMDEDDLDDIITYHDNMIDFDEIVKEQIISNIPMKTICNENCEGLCRVCGVDLNLEKCKCNTDDDENIDPRLAKLKELLQQD